MNNFNVPAISAKELPPSPTLPEQISELHTEISVLQENLSTVHADLWALRSFVQRHLGFTVLPSDEPSADPTANAAQAGMAIKRSLRVVNE
jgi:hypothetical protein